MSIFLHGEYSKVMRLLFKKKKKKVHSTEYLSRLQLQAVHFTSRTKAMVAQPMSTQQAFKSVATSWP